MTDWWCDDVSCRSGVRVREWNNNQTVAHAMEGSQFMWFRVIGGAMSCNICGGWVTVNLKFVLVIILGDGLI